MRKRYVSAALLCLLLFGSGKSGSEPRALTATERLEQSCGKLGSRIGRVTNLVALRDPQRGYVSPALVQNLREAARETQTAVEETRSEMGRIDTRYGSVVASQPHALEAFLRELPHQSPRGSEASVGLVRDYEAITTVIDEGCRRAVLRADPPPQN